MTTPDYADWTQPTGQAERDNVPRAYAALATGAQVAVVDTSQAQSAIIRVDYSLGGAAGDRYALLLQWSVGGSFSDAEYITFHSAASYQNAPGGFTLSTPARGTSLTVSLYGPAGQSCGMSVALSTRPTNRSRLSPCNVQQYRILAAQAAVAVPASGLSPTLYLPPCDSAINIRYNSATAAGALRLRAVYFTGGVPAQDLFWEGNTVSGSNAYNGIIAPRMGLEFTLVNGDGAAPHTMSAVLWDVS